MSRDLKAILVIIFYGSSVIYWLLLRIGVLFYLKSNLATYIFNENKVTLKTVNTTTNQILLKIRHLSKF